MKLDNDDIVWVAPDAGIDELGTFENPFADIAAAIGKAAPGQRVLLKNGVYAGDVTIQQSGTREYPIHVGPQEKEAVEIRESCWYFYDASDFIVSGLVFRASAANSISLAVACRRNCFSELTFADCCASGKTGCSIFLGGSGNRDTMIRDCVFERTPQPGAAAPAAANAAIGIMVSEGDSDGGEANRDLIIRNNRFRGYGYAILVGSQDTTLNKYGHVVEHNIVEECGGDAIVVKCGDTTVRGNLIRRAAGCGISLAAGTGSMVADNRIVDCGCGMAVGGRGHSVLNNCLVRCGAHPVRIRGDLPGAAGRSVNILVERNTIVDTPAPADSGGPVSVDPSASCVIRKNLYRGGATPVANSRGMRLCFIQDNLVTGGGTGGDGWRSAAVSFAAPAADNFENGSGYGAEGWVLAGGRPEASCGPDAARDDVDEEADQDDASGVDEADADEASGPDRAGLLSQSLFMPGDEDSSDDGE